MDQQVSERRAIVQLIASASPTFSRERFKQFVGQHVQALGKTSGDGHGDVARATLDAGNVCPMYAGLERQRLLRQAELMPEALYV